MVSLIGFIGSFSLVVVFITYFNLTLVSYLDKKHRFKIWFMLAFLSIAGAYLSWGWRVIYVNQFTTDISIIFFYWKLMIGLQIVGLFFINIAVFDMLGKLKEKSSVIIFIVLILGVFYYLLMLITGFDVSRTLLMDVSDIRIENYTVEILFLAIAITMIAFPNILFIRSILMISDKSSFSFTRLKIIELGIALLTIGIIFDIAKFESNWGMLIIRLIVLLGGTQLIRGFLLTQKKDS